MFILFILLNAVLPQEYINMLLRGDYGAAINYCEEMFTKTKDYNWKIELGDIYLDKLSDIEKAEEIYRSILKEKPKADGWVHYRLGLIVELKENFLDAAMEYQEVATKYRKPPLDSFALVGVERCFKKNYQDTVALVDGYNFSRLELDERMAKGATFGKKDEHSVLDQMILERLLYTNAKKYEVHKMESFNENLKRNKRNILLEEVRVTDIVPRSKPTEKEMYDYYKKNKENYKLPEEVKGKEIVVESESLANFIYDSLKKDIASFDTLAKLYSTAPTKSGGGNMGIVNRGVKPKEVEDVIFKAKLNTPTEIVKFDNKFGIYLITEHKLGRYRSYEEVKASVEGSVQGEKLQRVEKEFINELKSKAKLEIYKDSFPNDTLSFSKEKIVARLNGREIRWDDVERRNEAQPMFAKVDLTKPEQFENLLNTMIEEELKLEWAERKKYYLNDGFFSRYQEAIKRELESGLYKKIVLDAVVVDSQEIKEYYKKHKEDMKIPESVRAREIVVYKKEEAERIRKELVEIYGRNRCLFPFLGKKVVITDYTKFDSLAKEYSIAPTKSRGGDIGLLRRGSRPKEFDDVAFKLKPNSLSRVFLVGDSNWTIITVAEHNPTKYRPFDEVSKSIEANLRREKQRKVADEFLARIKQEANIKIMLPEPEKEKSEEMKIEVPPVEKKE